jgi:hypothetical protein
MTERSFARVGYWICVTLLAGFALALGLGIAENLIADQIRTVSKTGTGRLILKLADPMGFYLAFVPHALICGFFAFGAYWVWVTYLRRQ